jgi:hypothetical protein
LVVDGLCCALYQSTTAAAAAVTCYISRFSASVVDVVGSLGLTWQPAFGIILVLYFYSHYFFASGEQIVTFEFELCH